MGRNCRENDGRYRLRDDLGQPGADEEPERTARPDRLGRMRLPEQRAVVRGELVRVPRRGHDGRERDHDGECREKRTTLAPSA